eukprot:2483199-Alexandrium_andersonii.AAC.1
MASRRSDAGIRRKYKSKSGASSRQVGPQDMAWHKGHLVVRVASPTCLDRRLRLPMPVRSRLSVCTRACTRA